MIIYFNFISSKIELIQQRNINNYFAVDFLMDDKSKKIDFVSAIQKLCQNKTIFDLLSQEKNYVVLPDEYVGFDSLEVPSSMFNSKKHFLTKFDLIYNPNKNLMQDSKLFETSKNITTYLFCVTKKSVIKQIVETFKNYSINISGVSYFSKVLSEWIAIKNRHLVKENFVLIFPQDNLSLFAFAKGNVVGAKNINIDQNSQKIAKKYANFIKNSLKNFNIELLEEDILSQDNNEIFKTKKDDEIINEIYSFIDYFKHSNLKLNFENVYIINNKDYTQVDLKSLNPNYIESVSTKEILSCYKQSSFYYGKKGLLNE